MGYGAQGVVHEHENRYIIKSCGLQRGSVATVSVSKASAHRPPGPKGHSIFGTLYDYSLDPIGFTHWCAQEYGDVVYFHGLVFSGLQLNHPDYIEEVLVTKQNYFVKDRTLRILRPILGNGLITSEGDFWQRQR